MSNRLDRQRLSALIRNLKDVSNEDKSALLELLNEQKQYGLVWENHEEDVEEELREKLPILREVEDRRILSEDKEAPNHILIEGDNLHALTALSYTHEGKIDVIYIDPPYNTGKKDFIYNDSFIETENAYRHSMWLSFIHKRLIIAKRLLSSKGVIFISIDDNEQANLKILTDEILGERNFLGQLIVKTATDNNPSQINTEHEYMLCYCRDKSVLGNWERQSVAARRIINKYHELKEQNLTIRDAQKLLRQWIRENKPLLPQVSHYNNIDEKGVYSSSSNSSNPHPGGYMYDIIHPITGKPCPKPGNGWRWPLATFQAYDKEGEIEWGKDETTQPHVKKRIETSTEYLRTLIYEDNRGTTKALSDMFDGKKVFDNPKPLNVLRRIVDYSSSKDSIILDFFAGSGTTLHATMQLNAEDDGHRQCILVTNNENGICENVTYERNKRVINGYATPKGDDVAGLTANNLRYYKTDFVSREKSHHNKVELVHAATDLLCIKENIYSEVHFTVGGKKMRKNFIRRFTDGERDMLIIYEPEIIKYVVQELKTWQPQEQVKVYVFSEGQYAYNEDFREVKEKVALCALPDAIYKAYQRVFPKRKRQDLQPVDLDEADVQEAMSDAENYSYRSEEGGEA